MKNLKKLIALGCVLALTAGIFTGCGANDGEATDSEGISGDITVISREEGSGTRGAFVGLAGIQVKDDSGEKIDRTADTAEISNSTQVVITSVEGNPQAIGYISLGSLSDTVTAVKVDGAEATVDNIKAGTYPIARPFNIVTKTEGLSEVAGDLISFIMSADGQAIIEEEGYISVSDAEAYESQGLSGNIMLGGSSSVTPVMEVLKEAYVALNPDVTVEVQQSDSTTGVQTATNGIVDIGMASREIKDSEKSDDIEATVIAKDGIAVVVNNDNTVQELTLDQICKIFIGELTDWSEVQ
ncbi:MAG TPA: substrate-binding domain-containing protein [Anaerovoracaceae bacterium]|nr:substrate-binding domain-containing protein [Anaerovoracaceae bacterium]